MKLQIFLPFSADPFKPLLISVKRDATVEQVIGYVLYEFVEQGRQPSLTEKQQVAVCWSLRIVEDDGSIDDDFPGIIFMCFLNDC